MSLQRSCLYSIEPIGIGSVEVESLSSYISRLAAAHCITVGDIMTHLIAPELGKKYINNIVSIGGNGFYKSSSAINGYGIIAEDFIKVIESLTCRKDILETTFVNCRGLVPFRGLLKSSRYWCPSCFQADLESKQTVYERLSWTLQPFHKCIIHDRLLESTCPFCKSCMYTLERKSIPGYCTKCFYWLGNYRDKQSTGIYCRKINDSMRTFFLEFTNLSFERDCVSHSLSFYIENNFEGSLTKAADFFGYSKSTLWGWKEGANLAPLKALIDITSKLQLNLSSFISVEKSRMILTDNCINKISPSERTKKNHDKIKDFLGIAITEKKPYSLGEIAKLMECDRKLLTQMYPNECRQIKKFYLNSIEVKKKNKSEIMKKNINNAVYTLKKQGTYPTRAKIEGIIGNGMLREEKYRSYWEKKTNHLLMGDNNKVINLKENGRADCE
ncbi:TniQ family protein [Sporosarcina sp. YIM B06819]|uniref:TniQ family protein n=1 Tax=Sporosarcina sp. YIM B06819 TaxID=3081769 RepID=UPI00298D0808|nr:TniQ family protein [Sporosarcina sp. YIM B06819]